MMCQAASLQQSRQGFYLCVVFICQFCYTVGKHNIPLLDIIRITEFLQFLT